MPTILVDLCILVMMIDTVFLLRTAPNRRTQRDAPQGAETGTMVPISPIKYLMKTNLVVGKHTRLTSIIENM